MKSALLFGLIFVLVAGFAIACEGNDCEKQLPDKTIIMGNVTDASGNMVGKAAITVTCYHGNETVVKETETKNGKKNIGQYSVTFNKGQCVDGDTVVVAAEKDGQSGSASGTPVFDREGRCRDINVAVIPVSIPEFGVAAGAATMGIAAIGLFFMRRQ
jgi:hypothetical protein